MSSLESFKTRVLRDFGDLKRQGQNKIFLLIRVLKQDFILNLQA